MKNTKIFISHKRPLPKFIYDTLFYITKNMHRTRFLAYLNAVFKESYGMTLEEAIERSKKGE